MGFSYCSYKYRYSGDYYTCTQSKMADYLEAVVSEKSFTTTTPTFYNCSRRIEASFLLSNKNRYSGTYFTCFLFNYVNFNKKC